MVDTIRTLSALQALLADNATGDISAQDTRDFLVSTFPVATNYPPTLSNVAADLSMGNSTSFGNYLEFGDLVFYTGRIVLGSTFSVTTGASEFRVDTPVTGDTSTGELRMLGGAFYNDSGIGQYGGWSEILSTDGDLLAFSARKESATADLASRVTGTFPFTWTNGDTLVFTIIYQKRATT